MARGRGPPRGWGGSDQTRTRASRTLRGSMAGKKVAVAAVKQEGGAAAPPAADSAKATKKQPRGRKTPTPRSRAAKTAPKDAGSAAAPEGTEPKKADVAKKAGAGAGAGAGAA